MVNCELLVGGVFAGRVHVHGLFDERAHAAGVTLTVAVAGRPLTVNVTATGKDVPLLGAMASEYTALPPAVTVCDVPPALKPLTLKLKSMTHCVSAALVAATKFVPPLYTALIECVPTARDVVVSVTTPPDSVPGPSGVVPSRKLTVPVGMPAGEDTVAVSVTAFCASTVLAPLAIAIADGAGLTTMLCVTCVAAA
jgi:hypothetical protein